MKQPVLDARVPLLDDVVVEPVHPERHGVVGLGQVFDLEVDVPQRNLLHELQVPRKFEDGRDAEDVARFARLHAELQPIGRDLVEVGVAEEQVEPVGVDGAVGRADACLHIARLLQMERGVLGGDQVEAAKEGPVLIELVGGRVHERKLLAIAERGDRVAAVGGVATGGGRKAGRGARVAQRSALQAELGEAVERELFALLPLPTDAAGVAGMVALVGTTDERLAPLVGEVEREAVGDLPGAAKSDERRLPIDADAAVVLDLGVGAAAGIFAELLLATDDGAGRSAVVVAVVGHALLHINLGVVGGLGAEAERGGVLTRVAEALGGGDLGRIGELVASRQGRDEPVVEACLGGEVGTADESGVVAGDDDLLLDADAEVVVELEAEPRLGDVGRGRGGQARVVVGVVLVAELHADALVVELVLRSRGAVREPNGVAQVDGGEVLDKRIDLVGLDAELVALVDEPGCGEAGLLFALREQRAIREEAAVLVAVADLGAPDAVASELHDIGQFEATAHGHRAAGGVVAAGEPEGTEAEAAIIAVARRGVLCLALRILEIEACRLRLADAELGAPELVVLAGEAVLLDQPATHSDRVPEGLATLDTRRGVAGRAAVLVVVGDLHIERMADERGAGRLVAAEGGCVVDHRGERPAEDDATFAIADGVVRVAGLRDAEELDARGGVTDHERDPLAAFEESAVLQVVDRAAGAAEQVEGVDKRLVVARGMGAELGVSDLGLVIYDELPAVEGPVILEELEAAHAGAEAAEHGAALVGLDEDVDLAATLHIGHRLGAVAVDGVGALGLDDLVDEGLKLAALAGVGMRGDIEPLGEVAEELAAADVALEVDAALSVDLHAAIGGEGVVFVAAFDAGIGGAERGVGKRHDEEA